MTSPLGIMMLFAALVAVVFATLQHDSAAAQRRFAARVFLSLVLGAYAAGWVMYLGFR